VQDIGSGSREKQLWFDMLDDYFEIESTSSGLEITNILPEFKPDVLVIELYQLPLDRAKLEQWPELFATKMHARPLCVCLCPQSALHEAIALQADLTLQKPMQAHGLVKAICDLLQIATPTAS